MATRTSLYYNSFLPWSIREWNSLSADLQNADSLTEFKTLLNRDKPKPNPLFNFGARRLQTLHTRLRTKCSSLNQRLYLKNIVDSPLCSCGRTETPSHYFFHCPRYDGIRQNLLRAVSVFSRPTIGILLNGDPARNYRDNTIIFRAVHVFIEQSKRFDS